MKLFPKSLIGRLLLLTAVTLSDCAIAFTQTEQQTINRLYGTQTVLKQLQGNSPADASQVEQIHKHVQQFTVNGTVMPITIPLIFHIFPDEKGPSVSMEQIAAQIEILNADFETIRPEIYQINGTQGKYAERASAPMFTFCLYAGQVSPLNFISTTAAPKVWGLDDRLKKGDEGGVAPMLPDSAINIWVCDLSEDYCGYAQMPGWPINTDGIVIDKDYFFNPSSAGSITNSHTLSHLLGSYFGLYELWDEINPCFDDWVFDTPIHNESNAGVELTENHVSTCFGNELEMTINFMDNAADSVQLMFTSGQVLRMQAMVSEGGPRHGLSLYHKHCNETDSRNMIVQKSTIKPDGHGKSLQLFPNPAAEFVSIGFQSDSNESVSLFIFDAIGRMIWRNIVETLPDSAYNETLPVSTWQSGIYTVMAVQNGQVISRQLIIE